MKIIENFLMRLYIIFIGAGVAQLVEHQPSKLRVAGSIPVSRSNLWKLYFKPCRVETDRFYLF